MFSYKFILGGILMAAVGDFLAVKYYPEGGSRFLWTFHQMKGNLMKVQNFTHRLADMFCNDPEQCKNATDEFFLIAASLPQDVVLQFADLMSKFGESSKQQEGGEVINNRKHSETKRAAVTYSDQLTGDPKKGETVIKSLKFSSYDENNLCDLMEGIPPEEYDATVDEIAELTNMPEKLKKVIKRAKNFSEGKVQAIEKLQFKTEDGNWVFGRVAVIRRGKLLDMAYSLHAVAYEVAPRQRRFENAQKLEQFFKSLDEVDEGGQKESQGISMELRDDFLAFFHKQAIEGFVKHCDFVLKALNDDNKDAEILQHIGVSKDGKAVEEDKIAKD